MEIISRKEAKATKLPFYFTGIECPYGHMSQRYTTTANCVMCHAVYHSSDAQKDKQKKYRELSKDKKAIYDRKFSKENAAYRNSLKSANRVKRKQRIVSWNQELTSFVTIEAYNLAKLRNKVTGIEWHIDHVVPLCGTNVCGFHVWNNLAVIPAQINLSKGNKFKLEQYGDKQFHG